MREARASHLHWARRRTRMLKQATADPRRIAGRALALQMPRSVRAIVTSKAAMQCHVGQERKVVSLVCPVDFVSPRHLTRGIQILGDAARVARQCTWYLC
ncbi:hypothetical protein P170DRAFT_21371 [Aspergillus steynii IBT 23096]|uniref:Uncharacterized protein n=1 Tax=Aspergillus steynii IBT 23096 TaxID=1392250 RepID=A0A2I2GP00_9EURO|nr:uncharacterized protein P170DRAFT_21371 [Aspergillus steynii IBT 23096]PLB54602.1 hypothetical protein P170DRAFT_21371 [Aspergillus steynii IBT 23096]